MINNIIFNGVLPGRIYIQRFLLILACLTPLVYFYQEALHNFAWYSWLVLVFVFYIRPLTDVFPKVKIFRTLVALRKEAGILCGAILLAHGFTMLLNYGPSMQDIIDAISPVGIWKRDGYIIAFLLTITSNTWSMRVLKKYWKYLHYLTYLFFLKGSHHTMIATPEYTNIIITQVAIGVILWILAFNKITLWK